MRSKQQAKQEKESGNVRRTSLAAEDEKVSLLQALTKENSGLNECIRKILTTMELKHEDHSDKLGMLNKIEQQLDYLAEARDYINTKQPRELRDKESDLVK